VKDEDGRLMNDFTGRIKRDEWKPPSGFQRTLTVALDTAQYQIDMEAMAAAKTEDVYSSFNVLMRRKPKVSMLQILASKLARPRPEAICSIRALACRGQPCKSC
jgi:hypothetical protein